MTQYIFNGKVGNLDIEIDKLGHPFTHNVDATIDNLRDVGPVEIIVKNHKMACGEH